jgi:hypothetical protein
MPAIREAAGPTSANANQRRHQPGHVPALVEAAGGVPGLEEAAGGVPALVEAAGGPFWQKF